MYVILGAAGNVGTAAAAALRRAGREVRAAVRHEKQRGALDEIGCETVVVDLFDAESVARAIRGAQAVQLLCPLPHHHADPAAAMRSMIDACVTALRADPPDHVLALSDYGAEHASGTGITMLFHYLETQLRTVDAQLTFLRSAEHMHNWARVLPMALARGVLPSLHHPLDKRFPTVAAQDVGIVAARLLLDADVRVSRVSPRVVSVESEQRVSVLDVARTISEVSGHAVTAHEVPRDDWNAVLQRSGLGELHARLIADLYDAHNAGRIDVEADVGERRFGTTTLSQVFAALVPQIDATVR
ncbi:NAD(P)H dehydrogenase (quinone) [Paraburkholderia sp. GAS333]|uniref:NAD(P)H-binding protein n=1 Tax=Paraburkholderia sp. GAS333 TaxID=3156279 RepID=UPI003D1D62D3